MASEVTRKMPKLPERLKARQLREAKLPKILGNKMQFDFEGQNKSGLYIKIQMLESSSHRFPYLWNCTPLLFGELLKGSSQVNKSHIIVPNTLVLKGGKKMEQSNESIPGLA